MGQGVGLGLVVLTGLAGCAPVAPERIGSSIAETPQAARGADLARTRCAACHAVARAGESPMSQALPFRSLHERYPVAFLQEALAEGLMTAHPAMPEVELAPTEIADLIAYLESLERD